MLCGRVEIVNLSAESAPMGGFGQVMSGGVGREFGIGDLGGTKDIHRSELGRTWVAL